MKGKAKKGDLRDICGTVCCPNAVFAYLRATKCSAVLMLSLHLFFNHVNRVIIAKITKKNRKTYKDSFFYYFSLFFKYWFSYNKLYCLL